MESPPKEGIRLNSSAFTYKGKYAERRGIFLANRAYSNLGYSPKQRSKMCILLLVNVNRRETYTSQNPLDDSWSQKESERDSNARTFELV
jgi:hypothetical protein